MIQGDDDYNPLRKVPNCQTNEKRYQNEVNDDVEDLINGSEYLQGYYNSIGSFSLSMYHSFDVSGTAVDSTCVCNLAAYEHQFESVSRSY